MAETISLSLLEPACLGRKPTASIKVILVQYLKAFDTASCLEQFNVQTTTLPKVNSLVAKPEADRAATNAEGPGIGKTGIL